MGAPLGGIVRGLTVEQWGGAREETGSPFFCEGRRARGTLHRLKSQFPLRAAAKSAKRNGARTDGCRSGRQCDDSVSRHPEELEIDLTAELEDARISDGVDLPSGRVIGVGRVAGEDTRIYPGELRMVPGVES